MLSQRPDHTQGKNDNEDQPLLKEELFRSLITQKEEFWKKIKEAEESTKEEVKEAVE